jgi:(2Fe-2S) ferredoxin
VDGGGPTRVAVLLAARSAVAATPLVEMQAIADKAAAFPGVARVAFGFTELGAPTLRDALLTLIAEAPQEILLLPLLVPMEPSFKNWVTRAVARWRTEQGRDWPPIRLAPPPLAIASFDAVVTGLVSAALAAEPMATPAKQIAEATLVPAQQRRVLVCLGGPCNNAGATAIWNHWRREQDRRRLRSSGGGVASCKTSCLGPCELGPVVQIFPEGTYYGGVDEAGVERIIAEHIQHGRVVADLAYAATGKKQSLRRTAPLERAMATQPEAKGSTT